MYNITKNVIAGQCFELTDILAKIDVLWLQGSLTDDQHIELQQMAREKADPSFSVNVLARIADHEARLRALEAVNGQSAPDHTAEWPEWEHHHAYRRNDRVTFEGRRYVCRLPGHIAETTWSPKDYPEYWQAA